jgi:acetyl-CoA synthetase
VVNLWITAETGIFALKSRETKMESAQTFLPPSFQEIIPVFKPEVTDNSSNLLSPGRKGILAFQQSLPSMFNHVWDKEVIYLQYWTDKGVFLSKDFAEQGEEGFIKLLGHRSMRVINIGGLIVAAELIEMALARHKAIAGVEARGVPDKTKGQVVEMTVKLKNGVERSHQLRSELLNYARIELGPAVIIKQIVFV